MPDDLIISSTLPQPKAPLWKRVRAWTVIVGLYAIVLGMVWFAGTFFLSAIKPGVAWDDRLYKSLLAVGLLVIPFNVARVYVKRRRITGSWLTMTDDEKEKLAARRLARQGVTTPTAACGVSRRGTIRYAFDWAGYTKSDKAAKPAKRTLAWTMTILYSAYVTGIFAFGLIAIIGSFDDSNTAKQQALMILMGLVLLIYPALVIRTYWRRFQATGSLHVSKQELQSAAAQMETKRDVERQKPLRSKLLSAAFVAAIASVWWIRVTVYHSRHPRESWVSPAIFTITWLYSFCTSFRKDPTFTTITPQNNGSEPAEL